MINRVIEELESQCWVDAPCDFDMDAGGLSTVRKVFDKQKFAMLIIQECISAADLANDESHDQYAVGARGAIREIRERFGVK